MYITSIYEQNTSNMQRQALLYLYNRTTNLPFAEEEPYYRVSVRESDQLPPIPGDYALTHDHHSIQRRLDAYVPSSEEHYETFSIPKHSGGYRTITAPKPELKQLQRDIVHYLTYTRRGRLPIVHAHDCAFAYIKGRSTKHALERHQRNDSRWFLKLDLKDFFDNCNISDVYTTLRQIYPICLLAPGNLERMLRACCLRGSLPQGAPSSPVLSNLTMLPIDKKLAHMLAEEGYIYTRYADDLLISHRYDFNWQQLTNKIQEIFEPTPFRINTTKTRYGSRAGQNWNLGLMLNKDNKITIGHKKKERLRLTLYQFMSDPESYTPEDKYALQGTLSYFRHIEPQYYQQTVSKYERKLNKNLKELLK